MRRARSSVLLIVVAAGCASAAASTACGAGSEADDESARAVREPFLAFATDFDGFRAWPSFDLGPGLIPGNDHLNGPRRIYVNRRPQPTGAFPVGTIIVKESGDDGDLARRKVFAMVKRGGGFNADGAVGWEWFELANVTPGQVAIVWRGLGPADGDVYGGDASGGCNGCHRTAHANDCVFSPALIEMIEP